MTIEIKEWKIALMALFGWSTIDLPAHLGWWILGTAPHGMMYWIGIALIACMLDARWKVMSSGIKCRAVAFTIAVIALLWWIVEVFIK